MKPIRRGNLLLLILLVARATCRAADPADHQRRIVGRMIWPNGQTDPLIATASFSRQMLIKFPSSGSLERNPVIIPPPRHLVPPAYSAEALPDGVEYPSRILQPPEYSAESALRQLKERPELLLRKVTKQEEQPSAQPSLLINSFISDEPLLPPIRTAGRDGSNPCTHPQHSWLCNNRERATDLNPKSSNRNPKQFSVPEVTTRKPSVKSVWDGVDPCTHPQHSWRCQPAPGRKQTTSFNPAFFIPDSSASNANSQALPERNYLPPEASVVHPDLEYLPPPPPARTTPEPPPLSYLPPEAPLVAEPELEYLPPPPPTVPAREYLPPPLPKKPELEYLPPPLPQVKELERDYLPPPPPTEPPRDYLPPVAPQIVEPELDYLPPPPPPLPKEPELEYLPPPPPTVPPREYLPPAAPQVREPERDYLPPPPPTEPSLTYLPPTEPPRDYIPPPIPKIAEPELEYLPPPPPTEPSLTYLPPEEPRMIEAQVPDRQYLPPAPASKVAEPDRDYLPPPPPPTEAPRKLDLEYLPPPPPRAPVVQPEVEYLSPPPPRTTAPPTLPPQLYLPPEEPERNYLPPVQEPVVVEPEREYLPPAPPRTTPPPTLPPLEYLPPEPVVQPELEYLPPPPPPRTTVPPPTLPPTSYLPPAREAPPTLPPTSYLPPVQEASVAQPEVEYLPPPSDASSNRESLVRTTASPAKSGWDEADSCSHPIHSWLCNRPKPRTTGPRALTAQSAPSVDRKRFQPPPAIRGGWDGADPCSHPLHSWMCDNRGQRNALPPAEEKLPEASRSGGQQVAVFLRTTPPLTVHSDSAGSGSNTREEDPCAYPHNRWRCQKNKAVDNPLRVGRQPVTSAPDDGVESITWIQNFESKRIRPSARDARP